MRWRDLSGAEKLTVIFVAFWVVIGGWWLAGQVGPRYGVLALNAPFLLIIGLLGVLSALGLLIKLAGWVLRHVGH
jgi:hypothetical protein